MHNGFEIIVDRDVSAAEAPQLAARIRGWLIERCIITATPPGCGFLPPWLHRPGPAYAATLKEPRSHGSTGVRGVYFKVKRAVTWDAHHRLTCRACKVQFEPEGEGWGRWREAAEAWLLGDDSVHYVCPHCGVSERLVEWEGEAPWGFGHLGVAFWGWAPLSERFIREVATQLGHRTVVARGWL
ncbi:hypothetical protein F0U61_49555 [Archangium violaceum]|uniref:hypothetical protein n=1 Tax=Archangium violaceum TaxID=83451 RepID=UPI002B28DFBE|nr:hypothetical protein F0U61_49555 [Archangium violaceum]